MKTQLRLIEEKMISTLDDIADELKEIDEELYQEYQETINNLENISDEEYQIIKNDMIESVIEIIKNEGRYETDI
ncbi:hypothetical protein [Streptococcus infantis]|uniref:hypothetical protein n=1 Tax=Streptococcus infantis TaxID=68892 RepID=UPI00356319DD